MTVSSPHPGFLPRFLPAGGFLPSIVMATAFFVSGACK